MEKSFAEIDALRGRLGINQVDMCRVAEVSESTISKARSEQRDPSPRIRRKLTAALDVIAKDRGIVLAEDLQEGNQQ